MTEIETKTYWRNSERVEAIRLTEENIQAIAYMIGAFWDPIGNGFGRDETPVPNMFSGDSRAFVGDWVLMLPGNGMGDCKFVSHPTFEKNYNSHEQRMPADEQYAKVYLLVKSAMTKQDSATYHDRGSSDEMDLIAIQTTKQILREL
jgi:hypothetical protein